MKRNDLAPDRPHGEPPEPGYKRSVVKVVDCQCEEDDKEFHTGFGLDYATCLNYRLPNGTIYLPHRCDEWVIGTPNQARQLIKDLEAAIIKSEADERGD